MAAQQSATLAQPHHPAQARHGAPIPTADPAVTPADLWLLETTHPVALVLLLPYRRDLKAGVNNEPYFQFFAAHGYAYLLVDTVPAAASVTGHYRSTIHLISGETITASAVIRCTAPACGYAATSRSTATASTPAPGTPTWTATPRSPRHYRPSRPARARRTGSQRGARLPADHRAAL